jgi:hypothetical protein
LIFFFSGIFKPFVDVYAAKLPGKTRAATRAAPTGYDFVQGVNFTTRPFA